jgi:hypothetical protein
LELLPRSSISCIPVNICTHIHEYTSFFFTNFNTSVAILVQSNTETLHTRVSIAPRMSGTTTPDLRPFSGCAEQGAPEAPEVASQGSIPAGQPSLASEVAGLGLFGNEELLDDSAAAETEIEKLVHEMITEGSVHPLNETRNANEVMFKQALHVRKGSPEPCQQVVLCKAWLTPVFPHRLAKPYDHNMWTCDVDTLSG